MARVEPRLAHVEGDLHLHVHLQLPGRQGALVSQVAPRSPAAEADIRVGDFITEINGRKVVPYKGVAKHRPTGTKAAPTISSNRPLPSRRCPRVQLRQLMR